MFNVGEEDGEAAAYVNISLALIDEGTGERVPGQEEKDHDSIVAEAAEKEANSAKEAAPNTSSKKSIKSQQDKSQQGASATSSAQSAYPI